MKHLIYIILICFCIQLNGQNGNDIKDFTIKLTLIEKNSNNLLAGSIIEIFSGQTRIKTDVSDFDGISFFYLNPKNIIDNKILLKIHGLKCKILEKEFTINNDLNTKIYLEYGETEYTHPKQISEMYKKLNIKPEPSYCGYEK
ncbi:hypothetical protein F6U93_10220 [Tamlana haliotis]|uniref:Carboxypeptidase-like regulatory domain-containing protein n=1 Tax=Pseudotamlana haliotis TaxID=2614804 RepID=A0A6N6MA56_9FLAO|nr:hypothetical protein [Tamlana haliotis]KAB1067414.1 hypothetical protein F6U93_10220 [Tamlana haliotis]